MGIPIKYVVGSVCSPEGEGNKLIIHCCNDINRMGAGVALALMTKWPQVKSKYHEWHRKNKGLFLGTIQAVFVEKDIVVINMIGQSGIGYQDNIPPIRYEAIKECLEKVANIAIKYQANVHVPYLMGAGLAGGDWNIIEKMLIEQLSSKNVQVIVYDIDNKRPIKREPAL